VYVLCRHLSRRHETKYREFIRETEQKVPQSLQPSITDFATATQPSASSSTAACSQSSYSASSTRAKQITNSLVQNVIVKCGLPVSLVEHPDFRKFLRDVDPKYEPPCRQTVTYTLIPKFVEQQKVSLQERLQKCSSVSLTTDVWTDRRMHAYLGVTVHTFVRGVPECHLLTFKTLRGSHTGQLIAEDLEGIVREFSLHDKVRSVVTDNASNMLKAMYLFFPLLDDNTQSLDSHVDDCELWEDLSEEEAEAAFSDSGIRIACFCHSLQLVIRGGLDKSSAVLRPAMAKVSKLTNVVHQSQLFRAAYEDKFGPGKSIPSANDTRWNSMYCQLQAVVDMEQAKLVELLHETSHENLILSTKEYGIIQELVDVLNPFAEATDLMQGDKVITISAVVPTVLSLRRILLEMIGSVRHHGAMVGELLQQLHERFFHLFERLGVQVLPAATNRTLAFDSDVFVMATALDPKYAFHWLQEHPGSQDEKDSLRHRIIGISKIFHFYLKAFVIPSLSFEIIVL